MFSLSIRSAVKRQLLVRPFSAATRLCQVAKATEGATGQGQQQLSWVDFFKLRRQQRRINIASSVFTAFIGSTVSWSFLSNVEIDPTQMIFGFDPFMIFFAGFMGATGLGYMFGPLVGSLVFRLANSSKIGLYQQKNKQFLEKVFAKRVDPSSQSFSNPVPDYYGEKIDNIKSYRQWLRDCNAYRRKAKEFL
ncbi:unnamed protein product [Cyberlindnera jadinii]|uniref:Presequence translocated-associated motor subunit PAM17 n=1 Tax=Cyberlindnera jadinii (strain ATCC 18201 / CBS 1600 / BCRC 20928 / JCM 3617 / NBRC 0987 / NRRL Y-1542) TaxID=983966 RepID=A0A0H5C2S3_CYBJN|nr:mitochondrial import protein Pam17 [Cyberlindnera jadinii NRRL Y-1542]ODV72254.1 mitochondrial import protein Pam17 [Cyberlindnera jadinii NRRL Y-1542]CEP21912.1 unnamed protein product [Cyberlindnera jadinii]